MIVKLLKRVENIESKGQFAHYEQKILLPQGFQMSSAVNGSECVYELERNVTLLKCIVQVQVV